MLQIILWKFCCHQGGGTSNKFVRSESLNSGLGNIIQETRNIAISWETCWCLEPFRRGLWVWRTDGQTAIKRPLATARCDMVTRGNKTDKNRYAIIVCLASEDGNIFVGEASVWDDDWAVWSLFHWWAVRPCDCLLCWLQS